eukprot:jgi/Mesvir1/4024/Mv05821-RA.1
MASGKATPIRFLAILFLGTSVFALAIVAAGGEIPSLEARAHGRRVLHAGDGHGGGGGNKAPAQLSFQDYLDIHNLIGRYFLAADSSDVDAFMACWVEKEEDFGGFDNMGLGNWETLAEMRHEEEIHFTPRGLGYGKRHQASNVQMTALSKDLVSVTHYLTVTETRCPPFIVANGVYPDSRVLRTAKGWRFQKRTLVVDDGFFTLFQRWVEQGVFGEDGLKVGNGTIDRCTEVGAFV